MLQCVWHEFFLYWLLLMLLNTLHIILINGFWNELGSYDLGNGLLSSYDSILKSNFILIAKLPKPTVTILTCTHVERMVRLAWKFRRPQIMLWLFLNIHFLYYTRRMLALSASKNDIVKIIEKYKLFKRFYAEKSSYFGKDFDKLLNLFLIEKSHYFRLSFHIEIKKKDFFFKLGKMLNNWGFSV